MNYYIFEITTNEISLGCDFCYDKYKRFIKNNKAKYFEYPKCPANYCDLFSIKHNNFKGVYIKKGNTIVAHSASPCFATCNINDLIYKLVL